MSKSINCNLKKNKAKKSCIKKSTKKPVKKSTKKVVKKPTKKPVKKSTKKPIKKTVAKPVNKPTKIPVKESTDKSNSKYSKPLTEYINKYYKGYSKEEQKHFDSLDEKSKRKFKKLRRLRKAKEYRALTNEDKKLYEIKNMSSSSSKPVKLCAKNDKCVNSIMKCNEKYKIHSSPSINLWTSKDHYDCVWSIYHKFFPRKKRSTKKK